MNSFKEMFPLARMFPVAVMHGGRRMIVVMNKDDYIAACETKLSYPKFYKLHILI